MKSDDIKRQVKEGYAKVARQDGSCCSGGCCCGGGGQAEQIGKKIGYSDQDMTAVPDGSNLGLGCGNPLALAALKPGETVLDLGSGAGFDCFLAANRVGPTGHVIGVDMTEEMIAKARKNAETDDYDNVEFLLGEIEALPVDDNSIDVVISNCVINLVPDKAKAFAEAYRVLKPAGRLMVSDIVLVGALPDAVRQSVEAYVGCLAGAIMEDDYLQAVRDAGFGTVEVQDRQPFALDVMLNDATSQAVLETPDVSIENMRAAETAVVSIKVYAVK